MRVRSLWDKYYADAHGFIFVMDSADVGRFEEARMAFGERAMTPISVDCCNIAVLCAVVHVCPPMNIGAFSAGHDQQRHDFGVFLSISDSSSL